MYRPAASGSLAPGWDAALLLRKVTLDADAACWRNEVAESVTIGREMAYWSARVVLSMQSALFIVTLPNVFRLLGRRKLTTMLHQPLDTVPKSVFFLSPNSQKLTTLMMTQIAQVFAVYCSNPFPVLLTRFCFPLL